MSQLISPEKKAERLKKLVPWVISGVTLALIAPLIWSAVFGLAGIAAFAAIGLTVNAFSKAFAEKVSLMGLERWKREIEKRPVEKLELILMDREERLKQINDAAVKVVASINAFVRMAQNRIKADPSTSARWQPVIDSASSNKAKIEAKRKAAENAVIFGRKQLESARQEWALVQQMAAMKKAAGELFNIQDAFAEKISLGAIETGMDQVLADFETGLNWTPPVDMELSSNTPGLTFEEVPTFDLPAQPVKVLERVK